MTTADVSTIEQIPIEQIHESPLHIRKTWGDMKELGESVARVGVLSPLLVRPNAEGYEVVFGHRRLRAAKLANLPTVPVMVRVLDDRESLEAQVIENAARTDVHPLEESEGFELLHTKYGYSVDDIAAKAGKSRAYVYARMKLLALCKEARKSFYDGKLSASTALLVARIPVPKLQLEAIKEIGETDNVGAPSYRQAASIVQSRFMLRLADAPFDRGDAQLVPKAGACTKCPKRTGNQPELFGDVKSPDMCTDPTCFGDKKDAAWGKRVVEAKAAGLKVLGPKETAAIFPYAGSSMALDSQFVALEQKNYEDAKQRTWREMLGKHAPPPQALARDKEGNVHELVPKGVVAKAMKDAGVKVQKERSSSGDSYDRAQKERQAKAKLMREVETIAINSIVLTAEETIPTDEFERVLGRAVMRTALNDALERMAKRRGLEGTKKKPSTEQLEESVAKLTRHGLRGFVVELLVRHDGVHSWSGELGENLTEFAALYKVDLKKIEASIRAQAAAKTAEKKVSAKGKKKTKTAEI